MLWNVSSHEDMARGEFREQRVRGAPEWDTGPRPFSSGDGAPYKGMGGTRVPIRAFVLAS